MLTRVKLLSSYMAKQTLEEEINSFIERSELAYNDRNFKVVDIKFQGFEINRYALIIYTVDKPF